jgi:CheY-like chemotaxis protein
VQDHVVVRVRDNGIGIPAQMLGSIFDLFTQVDRALDRSQGGLGIGLTLVRALVEMHGGKVSATSSGPGQGSEFVVQLPLLPDQATQQAGSGGGRAGDGPGGRRVLVVEDNRDIAESLALLLTHSGHEVRTVHDGRSALDAAREFRPHVVLLDIGLPELDGYEVARRLRQFPELVGARLVALTGYGQPAERRRAMEAGFDVHLVKPVDLLALKELLDRMAAGDLPGGR